MTASPGVCSKAKAAAQVELQAQQETQVTCSICLRLPTLQT